MSSSIISFFLKLFKKHDFTPKVQEQQDQAYPYIGEIRYFYPLDAINNPIAIDSDNRLKLLTKEQWENEGVEFNNYAVKDDLFNWAFWLDVWDNQTQHLSLSINDAYTRAYTQNFMRQAIIRIKELLLGIERKVNG